jgi:hypothetical protein
MVVNNQSLLLSMSSIFCFELSAMSCGTFSATLLNHMTGGHTISAASADQRRHFHSAHLVTDGTAGMKSASRRDIG